MFEQLPESQELNLKVVEAKYPRIAQAIRLDWGTKEGKDYLDSLVIDSRGDRAGFPFDVFMALVELQATYKITQVLANKTVRMNPWHTIEK